jgi:hypothetical protein
MRRELLPHSGRSLASQKTTRAKAAVPRATCLGETLASRKPLDARCFGDPRVNALRWQPSRPEREVPRVARASTARSRLRVPRDLGRADRRLRPAPRRLRIARCRVVDSASKLRSSRTPARPDYRFMGTTDDATATADRQARDDGLRLLAQRTDAPSRALATAIVAALAERFSAEEQTWFDRIEERRVQLEGSTATLVTPRSDWSGSSQVRRKLGDVPRRRARPQRQR